MRVEDPRPEPDIEWPGPAADIDGRRDIANAILADQSGADHGESGARGTSRRGYYRAQFESAWARYCAEGVTASQPSTVAYIGNRRAVTAFAGCDAVTAGKRQGVTRQQFLAFAHVSRWRNQARDRVEDRRLCGARSISGSGLSGHYGEVCDVFWSRFSGSFVTCVI